MARGTLALLVLALVASPAAGAQEHFRWLRRSECTTGMPFLMGSFGVSDLCADMTLEGCSETVRVGLRFKNQDAALVEQEVAPGSAIACTSAADLGGTPIDTACGTAWQLCFTFDRNGASTLRTGGNYLAGCPSIEVRNCNWMGSAPISLPLQCFENGYLCSRASDCDTCTQNGCGWCAHEEGAGQAGGGTCMEGNVWGPICGDCGSNCSCSWNYGKCPMKKVDLDALYQTLHVHELALANVSNQLTATWVNIEEGDKFKVAGDEYKCATRAAFARVRGGRTVVTITVCVVLFVASLLAACFAGKVGLADQALGSMSNCLPRRMRSDADGPNIYAQT